MRIIPYESQMASHGKRWVSYIETDDIKGYWPIHFEGGTEREVIDKALAHYETCREKREKALKNREDARERMKVRAVKKKENR